MKREPAGGTWWDLLSLAALMLALLITLIVLFSDD